MGHPKADVHRLYLPLKEGGRGLINILLAYKTLTKCISEKRKIGCEAVFKCQKYKGVHSIVKVVERFKGKMQTNNQESEKS